MPCQQHGFLRYEENVILNNFQHLECIGVGVSFNFIDTKVWYMATTYEMADVMVIGLCW